jgi:hypothetical protein
MGARSCIPMNVIVAAGNQLFQFHNDGSIWRSTGTACNGASCPGWDKLDDNRAAVSIAANRQPALPIAQRRFDLAFDGNALQWRVLSGLEAVRASAPHYVVFRICRYARLG